MISLTIKDIGQFMSKLLVKDTFDQFGVSEAVIVTSNAVTIDGQLNMSYYTDDELTELGSVRYVMWSQIKPMVYGLIKGKKLPESMRIVLVMTEDNTEKMIEEKGIDIKQEDVNGLFINIRYMEGQVTFTTASSLKVFTLDKSLDTAFEQSIYSFLDVAGIDYDEL